MKVLITGGAGFIGSHLADKLLKQNHQVIVIDNFNDYYETKIKWQNVAHNINNPNYKLYCTELQDKKSLNKIFSQYKFDAVVHLAGCAGVRPSLEDPEKYVLSNILGTIHLLELMKQYHIDKIVAASSSSVYGNRQDELFNEELNVNMPISPYAATKSSCEQFIYTYYKIYGIKAICLRFFTVYGPRQRPDLAIHKFTRLIDEGNEIPMYGDGTTARDYTYIDDIIDGIIQALHYNQSGYEIINLGGGNPVSLKQMIEEISHYLNKPAIIKMLPMQAGDVLKTSADISKAANLLNYCPKTTFSEGIRNFIDWYKGISS